jgi:hypothetical protein
MGSSAHGFDLKTWLAGMASTHLRLPIRRLWDANWARIERGCDLVPDK